MNTNTYNNFEISNMVDLSLEAIKEELLNCWSEEWASDIYENLVEEAEEEEEELETEVEDIEEMIAMFLMDLVEVGVSSLEIEDDLWDEREGQTWNNTNLEIKVKVFGITKYLTTFYHNPIGIEDDLNNDMLEWISEMLEDFKGQVKEAVINESFE